MYNIISLSDLQYALTAQYVLMSCFRLLAEFLK